MDFRRYVERNIEQSSREILKGFRDIGGKIGNERGFDEIRKIKKLELNVTKQGASNARFPSVPKPLQSFKDFLKDWKGSLNSAIKEYRRIGGHVGYNTAKRVKQEIQSHFKFLGWRHQSYKYEYLVNVDGKIVTVVSRESLTYVDIMDSVLLMYIDNDNYNLIDTDFDNVKVIGYYLQKGEKRNEKPYNPKK